ncbi:MAG TPA: hypothetical protein VNZ49_14315 [Bacteroidia bacterium]|jgi:hypothetical protein|nr:hypothetical protein [Bacteroidia bacterium]
MQINLHNYEVFFLDYKEGNLNAAQEKELFVFLEVHPELKAELDSFEELVLESELFFDNKSSLKKNEFGDKALITYTEGLIDEKNKKLIEEMASQNAAFNKELNLYKSAVLVVDTGIRFPQKTKLKRGGVVFYLQSNPAYLRMAAALLLLIGLFFLVSKVTSDPNSENKKSVLADENKKQNENLVKNNSLQVPNKNTSELAVAKEKNVKVKQQNGNHSVKQIKKNDPPVFATNTVTIGKDIAVLNNTNIPDTLSNKNTPVINTTLADNGTSYKSYYNYSTDDEDEKQPVTASAVPGKKTFFQKLTDAAHKVNNFGVKKVNGEEANHKTSLNIGGFVVSETFSN